jgi:putative oxidoreductase
VTRYSQLFYHACRLSLGGIFLYAGIVKALDVRAFAGSVANYQILPYQLNYLLAAGLPYVEMAAGLLLLVSRQVRSSALVLGVMDIVFMVALGSTIVRGLDIDCGCFRPGGEGHTTAQVALLRDMGFLLLAAITLFMPMPRKKAS